MNNSIKAGDVVAVKFGNKSNTSGHRGLVMNSVVLAVKEVEGNLLCLVHFTDSDDKSGLGVAAFVAEMDEVAGELIRLPAELKCTDCFYLTEKFNKGYGFKHYNFDYDAATA